jgi:pyruvate kinase
MWRAMVANVRAAAEASGRPVRIAADLGGPKLRTAPFGPGVAVLRVAPARDERGRVVTPAQVFLCASADVPPPLDAVVVPVGDDAWLADCHPGDVVWLRDARDAARRFTVVATGDDGVVVTTRRTVYLETGLVLERRSGRGRASTTVGPLPTREQHVTVAPGDEVLLTAEPAEPTATPSRPVRIACTLPAVLEHAAVGHRVWFDDGKIGAVVIGRRTDGLLLRITRARPGGSRLKGGKGINLPDTDLPVRGLTDQDEVDLADVADIVDIVNVSFVQGAADVTQVQRKLKELGAERLGIVLKIETVSGFRHLPEILLTAMRSDRVGVMIARGDLAVEAGFERLAEVQEEILWLCEAAHVPVVWATQVLDQLARTGRPSRAEITDVALGARAECIMLNKGPHVVAAMATLQDIHGRMHDHQDKKRALLRRLRAWDDLPAAPTQRDGEPMANLR